MAKLAPPARTAHPDRSATIAAVTLLVLSAVSIALMPSFAKLAFLDGSNPGTVVTIRTMTSVILLGAYMLSKGMRFRLAGAVILLAVFATLSSAVMNYSFLMAMARIDISLTILIVFAHPFLIALYYHLTGASPITPLRFSWTMLAFVGLALALAVSFASVDKYGLAFAVISALTCTIMVLAMVRLNEHVGGVTTNFHMALWSFLLFASALVVTGDIALPCSMTGWLGSVGNGVAWVIAYLSFLAAVRLIGASRATVLTFMEPVAAILLAALLFGERLTGVQWVGVALVALGLFFVEADPSFFRKWRRRG
jgi:drug/metabolite transporter (DMT)-like permease